MLLADPYKPSSDYIDIAYRSSEFYDISSINKDWFSNYVLWYGRSVDPLIISDINTGLHELIVKIDENNEDETND